MSVLQDVKKYREKTNGIPKDYMERLAYLYKSINFSKADLDYILQKIDELNELEWGVVKYIFYMDPKTTHRPRINGNTRIFYVKDAKDNKKIFDDFIEYHSDMDCIISTPCYLTTRVYTQTPSNMSKREMLAAELELIHHVVTPDWDNIGKTYSDMIQKTLILDDMIVCKGEVEKFYSILPRVEVDIHFMKSYDCKYNKKRIENRKQFKESDLSMKNLDYII